MKTMLAVALGLSVAFAVSAEDVVLSGGVAEIVKLSKSGVAPSVVQEYIKSSQFPFKATVDDVVYMHKEGVADEVITLMMKHGAEMRQAAMAFQAAERPLRAPMLPHEQAVPIPTPAPAYVQPAQQAIVYSPPVTTTYVDPYPVYPAYSYYPSYPIYYGAPVFYGSFGFRGGFGHGFRNGGFNHGGFNHGGFRTSSRGFAHR